ncbi:MAG: substrate-binding domain-containing protein [Chloroflexota bacterium]
MASWASYQAQNNDTISEFIVRDANGDLVTQIDDIQALLDADVDALIINPIELSVTASAPLQAQINIALNANIPVILVGNRLANETYTSYVGHDPYELGCIMGQELVALIDGEGIYGVINAVDLSLADTSFKDGERAVLANYPRMTVVTEGSTNYLRNNGVNITQNSVVDGLLGYTGLITLGAQDGLALQSVEYVPFVTDSRVEIAQFAIENNIEGVFVRSSAMMGATAVDTALAILRGETVTQFIRVVPELITMNNLSEFDLVNAPTNAYIGDWENLPSEFYP